MKICAYYIAIICLFLFICWFFDLGEKEFKTMFYAKSYITASIINLRTTTTMATPDNPTHRCFDCLWYSMWTGSCFNPSAQRCITEEECIADLETCDQFEYYNPATRYD